MLEDEPEIEENGRGEEENKEEIETTERAFVKVTGSNKRRGTSPAKVAKATNIKQIPARKENKKARAHE